MKGDSRERTHRCPKQEVYGDSLPRKLRSRHTANCAGQTELVFVSRIA